MLVARELGNESLHGRYAVHLVGTFYIGSTENYGCKYYLIRSQQNAAAVVWVLAVGLGTPTTTFTNGAAAAEGPLPP